MVFVFDHCKQTLSKKPLFHSSASSLQTMADYYNDSDTDSDDSAVYDKYGKLSISDKDNLRNEEEQWKLLESRYQSQIIQLHQMGYTHKRQNILYLSQHKGNSLLAWSALCICTQVPY